MWPLIFIIFPALSLNLDLDIIPMNISNTTENPELHDMYDLSDLPLRTFTVKRGQNFSMTCPGVFERSLIYEIKWLVVSRQRTVLHYQAGKGFVWLDQTRIAFVKGYGLYFHPVIAQDSGTYICLINQRPRPEAVLHLAVQDVPDPPGRPLIQQFTSRTVNLSWAPPQDVHYSAITHYVIQSRDGEEGNWTVNAISLTTNNRSVFHFRDLHPYTVYTFQVAGVNQVGTGNLSKSSYYMVTLRERPSAKPTIVIAKNVSSTAIFLSWTPPALSTIHGEFIGYRISYRIKDFIFDVPVHVVLHGQNVQKFQMHNLQIFTKYLVSIQVVNPEGGGPAATAFVTTDEGVPTKPENVTVIGYSSDTLFLRWAEPRKPNGIIEGYRIYFITNNYTDVETFKITPKPPPTVFYNITDLEPDTTYKVFVKAFTGKHEGESSDAVVNKTDIDGPSPPELVNLSCEADNTLLIKWLRPKEFYYNIDLYFIYFCLVGEYIYENVTLETHKDHLETTYIVYNVTHKALFEVQISAATLSPYSGKLIHGKPCPVEKVFMYPNCDKVELHDVYSFMELSVGMMAGIICAVVAFILAIVAFVVWSQCLRQPYMYRDDRPLAIPNNFLEWNLPPLEDEPGEYKGPIPVIEFTKHCQELHADGDIGFSKEYEAIQAIVDNFSSDHSNNPDNRVKNRYLNITAYDHTCVELLAINGVKTVDYINANYIDGFLMYKAYIGTQGPLPSTFDCFWRMVWEQHVTVIVMITNLVERGREADIIMPPQNTVASEQAKRKCDMYWPKEGFETYGLIQVKMVKEEIMATFTIRTFIIRHVRVNSNRTDLTEKTVYQYHYTNWPDHGTPDHPLPVINFVKKSASVNLPGSPIIVHCSAGVGRTGTYIMLDAMLKQIEKRNEVNVYGFLRYIRGQRNFLVQTEEQYIFIHDAIMEAIEVGETNISREEIPRYVQALQSTEGADKTQPWTALDRLFKLMINSKNKDCSVDSAHTAINEPKNRTKVVSVENSRVHLTPKPGDEGSDYINATWIQGFSSLREFIITQHPLKGTIKDFWQMVWDHNAQTIVMLGIIDNDAYGVFWPTEGEPIEAETYKIRLNGEKIYSTYVSRDFKMLSLQDDYELHVRMVYCANWPHHCATVNEIYHLPNSVQETKLGFHNGPIVVVDRYGGPEAGTFCNLISLKKQLAYENHADVYMYTKLCHIRRPGMWTHPAQLLGMHLAVQTLCSSPEEIVDTDNIYMRMDDTTTGGPSCSHTVVLPPPPPPPVEIVRMPPEGMEAAESPLTVA